MPSLSFTVLPSGVGQMHDLLSCLAKFDENISLEASASNFRISSLNSSKSTHACFTLNAASFFAKYNFQADRTFNVSTAEDTWGCILQNRALLSVFKKRNIDVKERDTALERCEFDLQAPFDNTRCRLVVRMICRQGVVKTYKLTYEPANVLRANFDGVGSQNCWATPARTLRDIVEYFGAQTDQLDWFFEKGKVNFTSFSEKLANSGDIFKQPMHTSVAIERKDFTDFNVQEGLHIGIVLRDFRAIVSHADVLGVSVTARYSRGNRPMRIAYESEGIRCEFTLMTRNQSANVPSVGGTRSSTPARDLSVRPAEMRQPQKVSSHVTDRRLTSVPSVADMHQSAATTSVRDAIDPPKVTQSMTTATKPHQAPQDGSPPAPSASLDRHSLFFPAAEDELFWDENDNDTAEREDFVTWDVSGRGSTLSEAGKRIRDSEPTTLVQRQGTIRNEMPNVQGIAPTQRLSQLKGLFD